MICLTCILQDRYPLQVMETGYDILFFWVARMAMLCNHFAKRPPFENIFLHAMVKSTVAGLIVYIHPTDKENGGSRSEMLKAAKCQSHLAT